MVIPDHILIELTYNCNHHCLFCSCPWLRFPELTGKELNSDEWCGLLKKMADEGVKHITFSGGEPLLKKDFAKLLIYATSLSFQSIAVFSNGLLMDENMLNLFQKYHIQWATSLPGFFSFKKLTGSVISARQLLEKVRMAADKKVHVTVNATVIRKNQWEIPMTVILAKFYGASAVSVGPCMPEGRALEHPEFYLSDKQYRKLLATVTMLNKILKIPVRFSYEQRCECYNEDGTTSGYTPESCTAGREFIAVNPDGWVRKCMHAPEKLYHLKDYFDNYKGIKP